MATNPTSRRDFLTAGSLGFLGLTLRDTLAAAAASPAATAKANSVILFWLEGGPSHIDTGIRSPTATSSRSRPTSPAFRSRSCCRRWPSGWTSSRWCARCTPAAPTIRRRRITAITGHEINPAMQFPSLGSIITKEMGPRNAVPPHVLVPKWDRSRQYEEYFRAAFLGGEYDPMCIPDPSKPGFAGHGSQPPQDGLAGGGREPLGIPEGGRSPLPRAQRDGRACQHGRLHRAGLEDDPHSGGARRFRSVERIRQDEGAATARTPSDSRFCSRGGWSRRAAASSPPRATTATPGTRTATTTRVIATASPRRSTARSRR